MTPLRYALRSPAPGGLQDLCSPGRRPDGAPGHRPGGSRAPRACLSARARPPMPRGRRGWLLRMARELDRLCDEARWQRQRHGLAAAYQLLGNVADGVSLRHAVPAR